VTHLKNQGESKKLRYVEELEYRYLKTLDEAIKSNLNYIIERFKSRFQIYEYWIRYFKSETSKKRLTDLGVGAERVFWKFISSMFADWQPIPIYIGSNLFLETQDAFINIDIKTVYVDNLRDYAGLVEVGEAQTSYPMKKTYGASQQFQPKISMYYEVKGIIKYSLAFFIQIIYEKPEIIVEKKLDEGPIALILISMPNGLLYEVYGDDIVGYPKSYRSKETKDGRRLRERPANYRYFYSKSPCYKLLHDYPCNYRLRIYFNSKYNGYHREGLDEKVTIRNILNLCSSCNDRDCYITMF